MAFKTLGSLLSSCPLQLDSSPYSNQKDLFSQTNQSCHSLPLALSKHTVSWATRPFRNWLQPSSLASFPSLLPPPSTMLASFCSLAFWACFCWPSWPQCSPCKSSQAWLPPFIAVPACRSPPQILSLLPYLLLRPPYPPPTPSLSRFFKPREMLLRFLPHIHGNIPRENLLVAVSPHTWRSAWRWVAFGKSSSKNGWMIERGAAVRR